MKLRCHLLPSHVWLTQIAGDCDKQNSLRRVIHLPLFVHRDTLVFQVQCKYKYRISISVKPVAKRGKWIFAEHSWMLYKKFGFQCLSPPS